MTSGSALPAAGSRVRSGLVWFGSRGRATIPEIEPLVRALRANHPKADISVVERAYRTAEEHHRGQMRKSGEPYITHPVAVATILAEMGMTTPDARRRAAARHRRGYGLHARAARRRVR